MDCDSLRRSLLGARSAPDAEVRRHLDECADCARFAARLGEVRGALARRRLPATPDADFATRVLDRLPRQGAAETFAWAALRVLPAALVLALGLAWYGLHSAAPGHGLADAGVETAFAYATLAPEMLP